MSSHTNFKLFLYIFGYRSTSGPSVAIGPPAGADTGGDAGGASPHQT